ncbi:hypothetical protein cypCar_00031943 [Cyprinus carpio]|nr:hypothetical protein cypCar_00031943 [Cyprinus carpio]
MAGMEQVWEDSPLSPVVVWSSKKLLYEIRILTRKPSFKKLIEGISGGKKVMCRKTLMQRIDREFAVMKEYVISKLIMWTLSSLQQTFGQHKTAVSSESHAIGLTKTYWTEILQHWHVHVSKEDGDREQFFLPQHQRCAGHCPEVVANAAEPPEAAALTSAPCAVVAPSNTLSVCHVMIRETITELSLCTEAMEAVFELSSCPVTAMEAVFELTGCPVLVMEAVHELTACPVTAMETVCKTSSCPVMAMKAVYELSFCPVTAMEVVYELSVFSASVPETMNALPVLSVSAFPRPRSLPWVPVPSAPPWWASVPSARLWWSYALPW